jgi:hypothetical protein
MPTDFARGARGFPCPQWWGESGLFDPGTEERAYNHRGCGPY